MDQWADTQVRWWILGMSLQELLSEQRCGVEFCRGAQRGREGSCKSVRGRTQEGLA